MRKRVKVEFQDDSGTKYTLAVEGRISREKVLKIMDLMELVDDGRTSPMETAKPDQSTTFGRILGIVQTAYAGKEFSSADVARDFEEQHGQIIGLSTVSTYLSRMCERGYLRRQKFGNSWVYRQIYVPEAHSPLK